MSFPARVHIILARDAQTAVVMRRGPSNEVCTLLWDRSDDSFTMGQWFRGRLYERRCDLSPDGKHFIYFVFKGKDDAITKDSWTAISRNPYLKAVNLWPHGGTWNGGGLFMTNESYWLNTFWLNKAGDLVKPSDLHRHLEAPFHKTYGGECPGVYYIRLQRDGWRLVSDHSDEDDHFSVFEKRLSDGWILRKIAHATINHPVGKGCYYDTHGLHHHQRKIDLDCPDWEWADQDRHRIVWVKAGILYTCDGVFRTTREGYRDEGSDQQLYNFNPLHFSKLKAPY